MLSKQAIKHLQPINRTINIQQLKKIQAHGVGGGEVHTCQVLANTDENECKMSAELEEMEKPRHAVSTCSPDCPTESAVERALVDLECRREAAGKRNGDTQRINTEVPRQNATVQRKCSNCRHGPSFLMKRNGATYEWIARAHP